VIVFGGIALIRHVETCAPHHAPPCTGPLDTVPVWPLVWGITAGGAVALVLSGVGRRLRARLPRVYRWEPDVPGEPSGGVAPHRFVRNIMQMLQLLSPDPPPDTEPKFISADDAEQIKTTAVVMQWGWGFTSWLWSSCGWAWRTGAAGVEPAEPSTGRRAVAPEPAPPARGNGCKPRRGSAWVGYCVGHPNRRQVHKRRQIRLSSMTIGRHFTAVHLLAANLLLGVLAAPELEGDDDLGDAAEQREEPDPQQQERRDRCSATCCSR
jgi:hypothetical protein